MERKKKGTKNTRMIKSVLKEVIEEQGVTVLDAT